MTSSRVPRLVGVGLLAVGLAAATAGALLLRSVALAPSAPVAVALGEMVAGYLVVVSGRELLADPGTVDRTRVAVAVVGTAASLSGLWLSVTVYGVG